MKKLVLSCALAFSVLFIATAAQDDSKEQAKDKVECCCEECTCKDCKCDTDCSECKNCRKIDECKDCRDCDHEGSCCDHRKRQHRGGGCHDGGGCC